MALLMGRHGFAVVTSEGVDGPAGPYASLLAYGGAATLSATAVPGYGADLPSGDLADGAAVVGRFQAVTVTAGTVLAYPEAPEGYNIS